MTTIEHLSTLPPPPPPPPPPAAGRVWKPIVVVLAGLAGFGLISGTIAGIDEVADCVDADETDSQDDATTGDCGLTAGVATATVTATNDSSGTSTYLIDVD